MDRGIDRWDEQKENKYWMRIWMGRQGKVLYADHQSVLQYLLLQLTVLTKFDQVVEFGNVLLSGFTLSLRPAVELGPFENSVAFDFKVCVELSHYGIILFSVLCADVS